MFTDFVVVIYFSCVFMCVFHTPAPAGYKNFFIENEILYLRTNFVRIFRAKVFILALSFVSLHIFFLCAQRKYTSDTRSFVYFCICVGLHYFINCCSSYWKTLLYILVFKLLHILFGINKFCIEVRIIIESVFLNSHTLLVFH